MTLKVIQVVVEKEAKELVHLEKKDKLVLDIQKEVQHKAYILTGRQ